MVNIFILPILIVMFVNWLVILRGTSSLKVITNSLATAGLLVWVCLASQWDKQLFWFAGGLLFSIAGNLLLAFQEKSNAFITGHFLLALTYLSFLLGLTPALPRINLASIFITIILCLTTVQIYVRLVESLTKKDKTELRIPVLIYLAILSAFLLSALLTLISGENWNDLHAYLVSFGAMSIFISNILLIWDRLVRSLHHGAKASTIVFQAGQLGIILGAVLHYTSR